MKCYYGIIVQIQVWEKYRTDDRFLLDSWLWHCEVANLGFGAIDVTILLDVDQCPIREGVLEGGKGRWECSGRKADEAMT